MAKVTFGRTSYKDEVLRALNSQVELALQALDAEAVTYPQKDPPVDTGRLRNSIAWATNKHIGGGPEASGKKGEPEDNAVYIGTNVEYAVYVEYGNQKHVVGKNHYLRDAAANHSEHYKEILRAALEE
jgi:hypothetical protein